MENAKADDKKSEEAAEGGDGELEDLLRLLCQQINQSNWLKQQAVQESKPENQQENLTNGAQGDVPDDPSSPPPVDTPAKHTDQSAESPDDVKQKS